MPISADRLQRIDAVGRVNARRLDGLAPYPPYPYNQMRNAILTLSQAIVQEGKLPLLFATLAEYERHGVFIHPKTAEFLLVMVDVYEGPTAKPQLKKSAAEDTDKLIDRLARLIGESPSELRVSNR